MKFKRSLLFIVSIFAVASCANNGASTNPEKPSDYLFYDVKDGVDVDDLYGTPWLNSAVEGMMEKIEKPSEKDDFFAATNYEYIQSIEMPKTERRTGGLLGDADNETDNNLYTLISEETSSPLSPYIKNAASYFKNGSKEEAKQKIDLINSYTTKDEIKDYLSTVDSLSSVTSVLTPFHYYSYLTLVPGGLLEDNSLLYLIYQYRSRTSILNRIDTAIKNLFIAMGYTEDEASDLSSDYASTEANVIKNISLSSWGGTVRLSDYDETFQNFHMENVLRSIGYKDSDTFYYVYGTDLYLNAFSSLSLEDTKKVLINRLAFDYAPTLGLSTYKAFLYEMSSFEFKSLGGTNEETDLVKLFERLSSSVLEKAYYDVYCDEQTKDQVMNLISDIKDEYKVILENNTWLTEATKQRAINKVDKMGYDACYPDEIANYPEFNPKSYSSAIDLYEEMVLYNKGPKIFNTSWFWPCYTVNGAYVPTSNEFIIFNGILAGGILTSESTTEEIYAQLGSIIGHEISHAFDYNGSYFDEDGNQVNWWQAADRQEFNNRISKMMAYINKIEVKKGVKMKGGNVNGEATADMGGVKVMLSLASKVQNFNYKKFFERYARVWAFKYNESAITYFNNNDEHPLGYIRTNLTLAQFDKFVETYDIKPEDGMYITPEDRIAIW